MVTETASFVFRRVTQSAAASSAPHSSPQPALPRPGAPGPPPGHSSREDAGQRVCRISAPPHPLPRPGWGRAARPPTWADPLQPQLRSLSLPTPPPDVSTPGQQEDRVFWAPPVSQGGEMWGGAQGRGGGWAALVLRDWGESSVPGEGRARREPGGRRSREVSRSRSRGQCGMRQEPDRPASSKENASWIPARQTCPRIAPGDTSPRPLNSEPIARSELRGSSPPAEAPGPVGVPSPGHPNVASSPHPARPRCGPTPGQGCTWTRTHPGCGNEEPALASLFPAPWERARTVTLLPPATPLTAADTELREFLSLCPGPCAGAGPGPEIPDAAGTSFCGSNRAWLGSRDSDQGPPPSGPGHRVGPWLWRKVP